MPYMQFYPLDWLYDTRILTDQEKAVLIDLLCFMWNAPERGRVTGHPQDLARLVGKEWNEFQVIADSLKRKKILEVTLGNGEVTLLSRRMQRDEKSRESARLRKSEYDKRAKERPRNAFVTPKKLEVRSQKLEKDLYTKTRFVKPTADEVTAYAKTIDFVLDGRKFVDHYESKGWVIGKSPMKSWQATIRTWKANRPGGQFGQQGSNGTLRQELGADEGAGSKFSGIVETFRVGDNE